MLCKLFQKKNQSRTREKNVSMGIFFFFASNDRKRKSDWFKPRGELIIWGIWLDVWIQISLGPGLSSSFGFLHRLWVSWGGCWQLHPVGSGLVTKRESLPSPNPSKIPSRLLLCLANMPIEHPRQWPGVRSAPTGLSPLCQRRKRHRFHPWVPKTPGSRKWQPTPVFLPGKFYGQKSLAGYCPWSHRGSDTTEQLSIELASHPQAGQPGAE